MITNVSDLLLQAVKAAIIAGSEIINIYNSKEYYIKNKSDNTPVTLADHTSHKIITDRLTPTLLPVLSEEGSTIPYENRKKWDKFWLIDPLDGTKEFINRNGEFTVNIALIKQQKAFAGVIYVPLLNKLYFGIDMFGAYCIEDIPKNNIENITFQELIHNQKKLPFKNNNSIFTVVASRSHLNYETKIYIENLKKRYPFLTTISKGSSLKLCLLAEGTADIYPRFGQTMEWDIAAGNAIINAAGGFIVEAETNTPLLYNKHSLINPSFIAFSPK